MRGRERERDLVSVLDDKKVLLSSLGLIGTVVLGADGNLHPEGFCGSALRFDADTKELPQKLNKVLQGKYLVDTL